MTTTADAATAPYEAPAGLAGVSVSRTKVSDVLGRQGFYHYRGYNAVDIARRGRVEDAWHLLLRGDLGTGKTTLVKGIAQALDAAEPDEVTSPTFTLLHEYDGKRGDKPVKLFHLDVYRIEGERQLETLGLEDLLTPDALVLVEWGEKFKSIRKRATGEIVITSEGGDTRKITVTLGAVTA